MQHVRSPLACRRCHPRRLGQRSRPWRWRRPVRHPLKLHWRAMQLKGHARTTSSSSTRSLDGMAVVTLSGLLEPSNAGCSSRATQGTQCGHLAGPCSPFTVFQAHAVAALYLFAGRRSAVAGRRTGHGASQPDAKAPLDDRGARRPRLLPLIRGGSVLKEVERSSCWLG